MADRQQNYDPIDLVKRVICVNKLKTPIFLITISLPNIFNLVYRPINSFIQYTAELAIPACLSSIIHGDFKYKFFKKTAPRFSDAQSTYSRDLIQCNHATGHKCLRGGPWCFFK